MKALNLVLAALFIVFAFLQINDPDPVLWILIYGIIAIACVFAAFDQIFPRLWLLFAIVLFAYSFTFLSGVIEWLGADDKSILFDNLAKMQYMWVEEAREFLGLYVCIAVLAFHLLRARSLRRRYAA